MQETFERIEKHLYKRQYQTAAGDWRTAYFVMFTDWKGIRRKFPAGDNLDDARDKLGELRNQNKGRYDWDKEKEEREKAKKLQTQPERLTIARYIPEFLKSKQGMASAGFWKVCCGHLERLMGSLPLDEVTRSKIAEYKQIRKTEPIIRHKKPVKGSIVSSSTVNREITALLGLLSHAAENGLLEKLPATKRLKDAEGHFARERVLDADEFKALLDASPRWLQRIIIGANEACLSRSDLLNLTVKDVHHKTGIIKLAGGRIKTKVKQKIPISPALAEVLDELERERRRLTSLHAADIAFTRDGKPVNKNALRKAFDAALKQSKLEDFHFHDLRHNAVTRWALAGIPEELRKIAAGHSRGSVHQRYINPPDAEIVRVFTERLGWKNVPDVFPQRLRTAEQSAN